MMKNNLILKVLNELWMINSLIIILIVIWGIWTFFNIIAFKLFVIAILTWVLSTYLAYVVEKIIENHK